jgi:hypothetical protein
MLKAARVSILVLLLACSAQAGYMQTGSPEPPPPQRTSTANEPTDEAEETTANGNMQNDTTSCLMQIALEMLAALPSLL